MNMEASQKQYSYLQNVMWKENKEVLLWPGNIAQSSLGALSDPETWEYETETLASGSLI